MSHGTSEALGLSGHRLKHISAGQQIPVGTFIVTAFAVVHDAREPLGYYIYSAVAGEGCLYFTDTGRMPPISKNTIITHILGEVNYVDEILETNVLNGTLHKDLGVRIKRNHFGLADMLNLLDDIDCEKLKSVHAIHLSERNSCAETIRSALQEKTGALVFIG